MILNQGPELPWENVSESQGGRERYTDFGTAPWVYRLCSLESLVNGMTIRGVQGKGNTHFKIRHRLDLK